MSDRVPNDPRLADPRRRVVVTGLGALTPIGLTPEAFWAGLLEGRSGAGPITRFDATDFATQFACELKGFDPRDYGIERQLSRRADPFTIYALVAAAEALADAGLDGEVAEAERGRTGVVLGAAAAGIELFEKQALVLAQYGPKRVSPFTIPMYLANMAGAQIALRHGLTGPNHAVASACATGNDVIASALMLLRGGYADTVVAAATEAAVTPTSVAGFNAMRALSTENDNPEGASRPLDVDRNGFVMGEGAGAFIMETLAHAEARGAEPYAEVLDVGLTNDAYHLASPHPEGRGARAAMETCLALSGLAPEEVDLISLHATSTPSGDAIEAGVIEAIFGEHAAHLSCFALKSNVGHMFGAAGLVEAAASVLALHHQVAPATINTQTPETCLNLGLDGPTPRPMSVALSNSFGFGGHNTTLALRRWDG
ncbi:MAG: beta-ketoacyl-ACP synthase II [Rubricoccaceae bacterium]|nr:beta-ketoacyl-ACP synthase II [Rubricoccaceae bacterium]